MVTPDEQRRLDHIADVRAWQAANPEKVKTHKATYRDKHRDAIRQRDADYQRRPDVAARRAEAARRRRADARAPQPDSRTRGERGLPTW